MQFDFNDLYPIVHPIMWNYHRVPMRRLGDSRSYLVSVGEENKVMSFRILNDKNMPDFVKRKLTMIIASSEEPIADSELDKYELYKIPSPEHSEIGWRASESIFVLVLSDDEFHKLRGVKIGGFNGTDTRSEG